jgi:hypothetical protein
LRRGGLQPRPSQNNLTAQAPAMRASRPIRRGTRNSSATIWAVLRPRRRLGGELGVLHAGALQAGGRSSSGRRCAAGARYGFGCGFLPRDRRFWHQGAGATAHAKITTDCLMAHIQRLCDPLLRPLPLANWRASSSAWPAAGPRACCPPARPSTTTAVDD